MTKPIKPDEVSDEKNKNIPEFIIRAFNELIVENWTGSSSTFLQKEAMARALSIDSTYSSQEIFKKKWFDVENLYRKQGWKVEYDKPGYNESYEANFTFRRKQVDTDW